ncbi:hypothetical protein L596_026166 [Steinernema carpocapsae]|uniref:Uncharacterized protein n=1 Tax=Steinernema carpocapsae TaxID=34508 RepID=A0A4U5M0N3_STECR|nr:hypothetical protein L596_026166 [Steinernema carpocapsae]
MIFSSLQGPSRIPIPCSNRIPRFLHLRSSFFLTRFFLTFLHALATPTIRTQFTETFHFASLSTDLF